MVLAHLFEPRADSEAEIASRPDAWTPGAGFARKTTAGETVSPGKAMTLSVWYACIRNIAEDIAKLPIDVFKRLPNGGEEKQPDHRIAKLLQQEPNEEMTTSVFRELMTGWAVGWGNAFAEIERGQDGQIVALWPIHPSRCYLHRVDGVIVLDVYLDDSTSGQRTARLFSNEFLHLRGFGDDPLCGLSLIRLACESLGITLAAQSYGAAFFGNGAMPSLLLIHPGKLEESERTKLRESWRKRHGGPRNSGGVAVMTGDIKVETLSVPPEEAQFLETRGFQIAEIVRWFRMPPHLVQDLSKSTNNNIEHQGIEYANVTLSPWTNRWEQVLEWKLLDRQERGKFDIRLDINSLMLGDSKTRAEYHGTLVNRGLETPNQGRLALGMNPSTDEGADQLWMQGAMSPMSRLAKEPAAPVAPPMEKPLPTEERKEEAAGWIIQRDATGAISAVVERV